MRPGLRRTSFAAATAVFALGLGAPPASAAKLITKTKTVLVSGQGTVGVAKANCPRGMKAVGGGFSQSTPVLTGPATSRALLIIHESRRASRGWQAAAVQASMGTSTLTVFAYCQKFSGAVKTKKKTLQFPAVSTGTTLSTMAKCPRGTKTIAGGFSTTPGVFTGTPSFLIISQSRRSGGRSWISSATRGSTGTDTRPLTSFAYCADVPKPKQRSRTGILLPPPPGPAPSQTINSPNCPRPTKARSGGFDAPIVTPPAGGSGGLVYESRRAGRKWRVSVLNAVAAPQTSGHVTSYAYCG